MSINIPSELCSLASISAIVSVIGCDSPVAVVDGTTGAVSSTKGSDVPEPTDTTVAEPDDGAMSSSGPNPASSGGSGEPACIEHGGGGRPPERVLFVVDASASMLEAVHDGTPGQPVVPWDEMLLVIEQYTACLGGDAMARAQFGLRLMPGPVGGDVCGRSDALDIDEWVTGEEILTRLAKVVPQGGRAMRRSLEQLPSDADLIVLLTHGAPGCGDDIDPEVLDTQVAETVVAQQASVAIAHVALEPGVTPKQIDGEPDGVDAWQELYEIGLKTETSCVYQLALFDALDACPSLVECLYGNRLDPCTFLFNPPESGDVNDVRVWIGDDAQPLPRVEECGPGVGPGWEFGGTIWFGDEWFVELCPYESCRRAWDESVHIQHSCGP